MLILILKLSNFRNVLPWEKSLSNFFKQMRGINLGLVIKVSRGNLSRVSGQVRTGAAAPSSYNIRVKIITEKEGKFWRILKIFRWFAFEGKQDICSGKPYMDTCLDWVYPSYPWAGVCSLTVCHLAGYVWQEHCWQDKSVTNWVSISCNIFCQHSPAHLISSYLGITRK